MDLELIIENGVMAAILKAKTLPSRQSWPSTSVEGIRTALTSSMRTWPDVGAAICDVIAALTGTGHVLRHLGQQKTISVCKQRARSVSIGVRVILPADAAQGFFEAYLCLESQSVRFF